MRFFCASTNEGGNALWNRAAGNAPLLMPGTTPGGLPSAEAPAERPTLAALPPLALGAVLRPLSPEDDLLAEMLCDRLAPDLGQTSSSECPDSVPAPSTTVSQSGADAKALRPRD